MNTYATEDIEGKFAVPEVMCNSSVRGKLDAKYPHHPLIKSETLFHKNCEEAELDMLRRSMGMAFPLKLQMERKAALKVGHLPCITTSVRPSYDALRGHDQRIGFDDIFGQPENFESIPALPFNVIENHLKLN